LMILQPRERFFFSLHSMSRPMIFGTGLYLLCTSQGFKERENTPDPG
jgi:hypothetical protein